MKLAQIAIVAIIISCICSQSARAEWSWSKLNPFGKKQAEKPPAHARSMSTARVDGKPLKSKTSHSKQKQQPSLMARMGSGTKRAYRSTVDTLTFKKKPAPKKPSGSLASGTRVASKPKQEQGSFFSGMFGAKKEEKEPQTVSDWMKQPRVEP